MSYNICAPFDRTESVLKEAKATVTSTCFFHALPSAYITPLYFMQKSLIFLDTFKVYETLRKIHFAHRHSSLGLGD